MVLDCDPKSKGNEILKCLFGGFFDCDPESKTGEIPKPSIFGKELFECDLKYKAGEIQQTNIFVGEGRLFDCDYGFCSEIDLFFYFYSYH